MQQAKVEQLRAQLDLKRRQVEALKVRAGIDGVLQRLGDTTTLQAGQQLAAGANVARVANPARLKAEIKDRGDPGQRHYLRPESHHRYPERRDHRAGGPRRSFGAERNRNRGCHAGWSVTQGCGSRSERRWHRRDRAVGGCHVRRARPVNGQADSTVGIFKIVDGGKGAVRVPVKLGANSVSTIVVLDGLEVGDQVILSDMSAYDAHQRVRLN